MKLMLIYHYTDANESPPSLLNPLVVLIMKTDVFHIPLPIPKPVVKFHIFRNQPVPKHCGIIIKGHLFDHHCARHPCLAVYPFFNFMGHCAFVLLCRPGSSLASFHNLNTLLITIQRASTLVFMTGILMLPVQFHLEAG